MKTQNWGKEFDKIYDEKRFTHKEYPIGKYRTKMELTNAVHPEKIKAFIRNLQVQVYQDIIDEAADAATGSGCLKLKFRCCGYHDACEDIIRKITKMAKEKGIKLE